MKFRLATIPLALALGSLVACQSVPVAKDAAKIELAFSWPKGSPCFGPSPAMTLSNIPKNTAYLKFEMRDLNAPFRHGGGTLSYTGDNIIPQGALKDYQGPCPPMGQVHTYEISVNALTQKKDLIVGTGASSKKFPE